MKLNLNEHYTISRDRFQFILSFRNETDELNSSGKNVVQEWRTYHSTLSQALTAYAEASMDGDSVSEILKSLEEIKATINGININFPVSH